MSPSEGLLLLLARCEQELVDELRPTLDGLGISLEHWRLIQTLSRCEYMSMTELAQRAVLSNSSSTRHIDALVGRGYVLRQTDPFDRRKVVVALTRRGRIVGEKCSAAEQDRQNAVARRSSSTFFRLVRALEGITETDSVDP